MTMSGAVTARGRGEVLCWEGADAQVMGGVRVEHEACVADEEEYVSAGAVLVEDLQDGAGDEAEISEALATATASTRTTAAATAIALATAAAGESYDLDAFAG